MLCSARGIQISGAYPVTSPRNLRCATPITTNARPVRVTCRPTAGPCDIAEACTGSSTSYPSDARWPAGHQCNGAGADSICDPADSCDGVSASCSANFASSSTSCGTGQCPPGNNVTGGHCSGSGGCTASCEQCGSADYQPCCTGPGATPCANDGLVCSALNGRCETCGQMGTRCCPTGAACRAPNLSCKYTPALGSELTWSCEQ